jgi:hypothetical protein
MGIKNAKYEWKDGTTDAHTKLGMLKSRKRQPTSRQYSKYTPKSNFCMDKKRGDVLNDWYARDPHPSPSTKRKIADAAGISIKQVETLR